MLGSSRSHVRRAAGGAVGAALLTTLAIGIAAACWRSDRSGHPPQSGAGQTASVEVTAIANEGFLIRSSHHAVLVDALFLATAEYPKFFQQAPSDPILERMMTSSEPFEHIDVVLVTHAHADHVDPGVALEFLHRHPEAALVGTGEVLDTLEQGDGFEQVADRVLAPSLEWGACSALDVGGVAINLCRTLHSGAREIENNVYIVDLDGFLFLHEGDSNPTTEAFRSLTFPPDGVHLAFVHDWFLFSPEGRSILHDLIRPLAVIPMHLRWSKIAESRERLASLQPSQKALLPPVTYLDHELATTRFSTSSPRQ